MGALSQEPRLINNSTSSALRREARRLKNGGYKREAGQLMQEAAIERVKSGEGGIRNVNDVREEENAQDSIRRADLRNRLRDATGSVNPEPATGKTGSASSNAAPATTSAIFPKDKGPFAGSMIRDSDAAKNGRSDSRRKELQSAYNKLTNPNNEAGNLSQIPVAGKVNQDSGYGFTIRDAIADLDEARSSTQALLKKYAVAPVAEPTTEEPVVAASVAPVAVATPDSAKVALRKAANGPSARFLNNEPVVETESVESRRKKAADALKKSPYNKPTPEFLKDSYAGKLLEALSR